MKPAAGSRYFLFACFALALIAFLTATDMFRPQEMAAFDWLMLLRPARQVSSDIVLITIDDATLYDLGRWPLPRHYHSRLIKALSEAGARLIVFDLLLSDPSRQDEELAQEMRACGRVVLPAAFRIEESSGIPRAREMVAGVTEQLKAAVRSVGHINIYVDSDGKVRRLPLWLDYGGRPWPSLGLLAAAAKLDIPAQNIRYPSNTIWISYPGKWRSFPTVSYSRILRSYDARQKGLDQPLDLQMFRDKICFVGLTAVGTSDLRANPLENVYPMAGVHASVCDSFLQGKFVRRLGVVLRSSVSAAVAAAATALCLSLAPPAAALACLALVLVLGTADWMLLSRRGFFFDMFLPVLLIAVAYAGVLLYKLFLEAQRRKVLEKELEIAASIQRSFLPPDLRQFHSLQVRTFLKPAKFVAGDFHDILVLDDSTLGVFIGDVSGKGVSASLIMAQSISLLRVLAQQLRDPLQVMTQLNIQLAKLLKGRFVTAQFLVIHTKERYWEGVCAGHPALFFHDRISGKVSQMLPASGPPLGLSDKVVYTKSGHGFNEGDRIFMYTDGWTEARDRSGKEFGEKRLLELFTQGREKSIDAFFAGLQAEHDAFEGAAQHDDLTSVTLQL